MCRIAGVLTLSLPLSSVSAFPVGAQLTPPAETGSLRVTVVEQGTGAPIPDADVTLRSLVPGRAPSQRKTGDDGTALFADLAVGKYDAAVSSPSYPVAAADNPRTLTITAATTATVTFSLGLNPVLRGQVVSVDGDPIPGATVRVLTSRRRLKYRPILSSVTTATTGSDGSFKAEDLVPGEYYLRVESNPKPAGGGNDQPVTLNPVYYGGGTTVAGATVVNLQSGDDLLIGIVTPEVPTVIISGRVLDSSNRPVSSAAVTVRQLDGFPEQIEPPAVRTDDSGVFTLTSIATGLYAVHASVSKGGRSTAAVADGTVELDVGTRPIDDVQIEVRPCARINGHFSIDGDVPDTTEATLLLIPEGPEAHLRGSIRATAGPKRTFELDGIAGSYRLSVILPPATRLSAEGAYLEDGTDILHNAYTFAPGQIYNNVRVLITDRTAEITGTVLGDADALTGAVVVVMSETVDADGQPTVHQAYETGIKNGRFAVKGVQTGMTYLIGIVLRSPSVRSSTSDANIASSNDGFVATATLVDGILRNGQATRVYVDGPGKFDVQLRAPVRH
jgi:carboxypeptidase family protein